MTVHAVMRSGTRIDLERPHPSKIFAADLAEHLAKRLMYLGGTDSFYSAAQHCVIVATRMSDADGPLAGLYGLMHHAHEAITESGGLVAEAVSRAAHEAFDLDWPMPADTARLYASVHASVELTERTQLCTGHDVEIAALRNAGVKPIPLAIRAVGWPDAYDRFLAALRVHATAANIPHLPAFGVRR